MKLYNLFEEIILEAVNGEKLLTEGIDFNTVKDSIDNKYNVNIVYIDGDGVRTSRYIQPYVLGDTSAGNKALRAYQIFGGSRTITTTGEGSGGAWRIFRLDRIVEWKPTKMKFSIPVSDLPSFMSDRGIFNPNGDKTFKKVDAIAKFEDIPVQPKASITTNKGLSTQPTMKPQQPKINPRANSYSTGKNPTPQLKKPINTSKTTVGNTSNTTAQQIKDKNKKI
jgi:hypothetical protein